MVPKEPWDLSPSSPNCKMLLLLPDILSPVLHLACHDVHVLQEAFLDSPPDPPLRGHEHLHCGTQSYQLGLSTHQTVRTPRARNWVQFISPVLSRVPGPNRNSIHSANIYKAQSGTEHRTGSALEKLFPQKRTGGPLSCSYPKKSNCNRVQPRGNMASKWLPHSVLQGRKQSVAKETSGTEKKYLIQSFLIPR